MKRTASSSASGSSSKRSELTELRHGKSYVSQRGLEEKMEHVRRHGVPDATSKRSQLRARQRDAGAMARHGPLTHELMLPLAPPHGDTAITVCNPIAMLHEACLCEGFAAVFLAAHSARPSSYDDPWNILVYNDEIAHNPKAAETLGSATLCIGRWLSWATRRCVQKMVGSPWPLCGPC